MSAQKILKRALAFILIMILSLSSVTAVAAETSDEAAAVVENGVVSVLPDKKGTKLTVSIALSNDFISDHKKETVYLFELPLGMDELSLSRLEPVTSFRVTSKYTFKTALSDGNLSRLYCSYVLALQNGSGYTPIGSRRYVENIPSLAEHSYAYPAAVSPKGLEVTSVSDALSLGVSHAVLPVSVENMFGTAGVDSLDYDHLGVTYHFSRSALSSLDDRVRALSNEGVLVYLRFELNTAPASLPSSLASLGYTDAPEAAHYALRADSESSAGMLAALFSLLAERYTDPSAPYGFCASFILGDEVNLPDGNYSTSHALSADRHVENYSRLVRIAHTALCSVYSEGRVFVATSNNFSMIPAGSCSASSSMTEFLAMFNSKTLSGGDYGWSISTAAYAYSRSDSSIWDDALATGASSQLISPANISVLTYALSKSYIYDGVTRRLIIGSFAVPDDTGSASVAENKKEAAQAASYAYAYYKLLEDGTVDALIYSDQLDTPDSPLTTGLSRADMSGNILSRKQIWSVMRDIDSPATAAIAAISSTTGGVLEYLYSTLNTRAAVKSFVTGDSKALLSTDALKLSPIFDFSVGERHGFESAGCGYLTSPALVSVNGAPALKPGGGSECRAVRYNIDAATLRSVKMLVISLASCPSACNMTLRLSQGGKLFYESEAILSSNTRAVSFDISEFCDAMSKGDVTLSISLTSGADMVSIRSIDSATSSTAPSILWIILIIIVVLFALMLIIALFTRLYHRLHRRRPTTTAIATRDDD
ncbi:MAG: hypothetical protein IJY27_07945 [Clostridia bacterium]|nr:hypothetical protein [Clostridia bacterium]